MSKRKFILLGYFLSLLFIFVGRVNAVNNFTVTVNGDMVTLSAKNVAKFQYSANGGAAVNICTGLSDNSTTQTCKISVKNGTYSFTATSYAGTDGRFSQTIKGKTISSSCSDQSKPGQTGSGTVERCMVVDSKGKVQLASNTTIASCASGYTGTLSVKSNGCTGLTVESGKLRYCKAVYAYNCTKTGGQTVAAAKLSALSVNGYSLSPAFNADTKSYKVSVEAGVSSVTISATAASGASFVQNYGPRTVTVKYGTNTYSVKVKNSAGTETVYKITVTRPDNRNKDNTLKRLTVDKGTLSPAFASGTTVYSVSVDKETTTISVGADLNHSSASFVDGFGPRTVNLNPGVNTIQIKVKNEAGSVKVYTVKVSKPVEGTGQESCNLTPDKEPYLKSIHLGPETSDEGNATTDTEEDANAIPQIENFDAGVTQYSGIKIPYIYEDLEIHPYVMNEGDTYEITGNENLVVNVPTMVTIKVTSKACPTTFHEYTLEVTRQPETVLSSEIVVKNITIDGHDEFDFKQNEKEYQIVLSKKEKLKKKDFSVEVEEGNPDFDFEAPKEIAKGRKYKITVSSEDGTDSRTYTFEISEIKGGASSFWLIILAIIVILVIIYIVLRLMGYRIYFNPAMLGAMFRGNGQDKFDK